uniref:AB hydrolase-1 domain-containing protein n=1 Tax=Entomoneis paludosa TaxID=265537 RepID=A0A7S2VCV4_9STRA|mmetsp:Transcript_16492/g.34028  ORF Transcript_16492/g.34028 Transcript_16492/m.34028 type:complete len:379 (+) Transcript_16492:100-1236(+)
MMKPQSLSVLVSLLVFLGELFGFSAGFAPSSRKCNDDIASRRVLLRSYERFSFLAMEASSAIPGPDPDVSFPLLKSYTFDGWNLAYQYKPAAEGFENANPLLLVHPVGIGLSSWFWNKFMETWEGPMLVAIDLIGCGIQHGADPWDPDERGLSVPLGWVKAAEALMQEVMVEAPIKQLPNLLSLLGGSSNRKIPQYSVVVQGGLAPVGVLLASRNPMQVEKLVMTSPPTWQQMTNGVSETELAKNYEFFRSPIRGRLAFSLLESRWAVQFFSNLFLFAEPCDKTWLDEVEKEACKEARPPVQVFNSGFCLARSFEEELASLSQPTLILQGSEDTARIPNRAEYANTMQQCSLQEIRGKNVLPWESSTDVVRAIQNFLL